MQAEFSFSAPFTNFFHHLSYRLVFFVHLLRKIEAEVMILKRRSALLLLFLLTFLALCFSCAKDGQAVAVSAPSQLRRCIALTFDDGPSKTTPEVLAALDAAGVHGTFFVVATGYNEKYLPLLTQAAAAGHQIALHSASHEYSDIYRSSAAYWKDIALLKQRIAPYVDAESIRYLRFPGGSTNTVSRRYGGKGLMKQLKAEVEQKGWHWVDWNVCAEDATASHPDAAQILRNIRRDADGQDTCVVLLHDTKATGQTVKALPDMIAYFREQGYNFCTVAQMDALQCETK